MNKAENALTLSSKESLIVHNYDLHLERQARIFAHAYAKAMPRSIEIDEKLEMLLLDDLTIFAINGRRLIDICGLQSSSNKYKIYHQDVDYSYEPARFFRTEKFLGFYSLLNQIIHMSYFAHFNTRRKLHLFFFGTSEGDELLKQAVALRDKGRH